MNRINIRGDEQRNKKIMHISQIIKNLFEDEIIKAELKNQSLPQHIKDNIIAKIERRSIHCSNLGGHNKKTEQNNNSDYPCEKTNIQKWKKSGSKVSFLEWLEIQEITTLLKN